MGRRKKKLKENPDSQIAAVKEVRYWRQLEEIQGMILAEQKKIKHAKARANG
ncbi:MAG: hypothetical protein Q4F79_08835 [Eubacteriales bacterium]|nr:hypothetical protein [Eubacteriales bacterium]